MRLRRAAFFAALVFSQALAWLCTAATFADSADNAGADDTPRLRLREDRRLVLSELPPILAESDIEPHLRTGLTTTFAFRLAYRERGSEPIGGARIEIRYELWDEVFRVVAFGFDGRVEQRALGSFDALLGWWHEVELVMSSPLETLPARRQARVTVDIVPFSESERDATQDWFADALEGPLQGSGAEDTMAIAEERAAPLNRILSLLMATSIQRKAVLSFRWNLTIAAS